MPFKYAYIIPIVEGVWYPVLLAISYANAVLQKDIPPIFPYVSDLGAYSTERGIFTFTLGIGSLLMFLVIYIRYRQVEDILKNEKYPTYFTKLNIWTKYLGISAPLGIFFVACFPVQPYLVLHIFVASTSFLSGWIIMIIQTYIAIKLYPDIGSKVMNIIRMAITITSGIAIATCAVPGIWSLILFEGEDTTQWTEEFGGYGLHLISAYAEWVIVLEIVLFFALYAYEFKPIVIRKPEIQLLPT